MIAAMTYDSPYFPVPELLMLAVLVTAIALVVGMILRDEFHYVRHRRDAGRAIVRATLPAYVVAGLVSVSFVAWAEMRPSEAAYVEPTGTIRGMTLTLSHIPLSLIEESRK